MAANDAEELTQVFELFAGEVDAPRVRRVA